MIWWVLLAGSVLFDPGDELGLNGLVLVLTVADYVATCDWARGVRPLDRVGHIGVADPSQHRAATD